MWDLVGNPEDRFSHNEAQLETDVWSPTFAELLLNIVGLPFRKKMLIFKIDGKMG